MALDIPAIKSAADLRGILAQALGSPRNNSFLCPFHDDHNPSLTLSKDGRTWKCWACDEHGDAIDFIEKFEGLTFLEAVNKLAGGRGIGPRRSPARPLRIAPESAPTPARPAYFDPIWQEAVDGLVEEAEKNLNRPEARPVRAWLEARGIDKTTRGMFRLGFISKPWRSNGPVIGGKNLFAPRGLLIPWLAPAAWYSKTRHDNLQGPRWCGANVRRLHADPFEAWKAEAKYQCVPGSTRGIPYPFPELLPAQGFRDVLVLEGELDALSAHRRIGHIVHCATIGGASQTPTAEAWRFFSQCRRILLAFDADRAGDEAAAGWLDRFGPQAVRARVPRGKDFSDFVEQGGNPLAWLKTLSPALPSADRPDSIPNGPGPIR